MAAFLLSEKQGCVGISFVYAFSDYYGSGIHMPCLVFAHNKSTSSKLSKGQEISKENLGFFNFSNKQRQCFPNFCPFRL